MPAFLPRSSVLPRWCSCLLGCALAVFIARGAEAAQPDRAVRFETDVAPILARRCYRCHGPDKQESSLRLDVRAALLRGGDFGEPTILPGNGADSFLVQVISGNNDDLVMPPEGARLTADEIALIRAWIDQGAEMPAGGDEADGLAHWSFQPLADVVPPAIVDPWLRTPLDAFVLDRLRAEGLEPSPPADRATLIRRLYLVMLGLPPAPADVDRFLEDPREDAYERLVERVLASPRYGERWARHWLDVVRFGETHGFETNRERPTAWHYRDYVIAALNDDKPYARFVKEQLAGDALGVDVATGFLVAGPYDLVKSPDVNLTLMQRQDELADMINTTGTALLGLTLGCARCHNHKFDPISQKDYYALQAVFAGVQHGERPLPSTPRQQRQLAAAERQLAALREKLRELGFREPVQVKQNSERFEPTRARYVRFTIHATNNGAEPCLDELEIFAGERNVGLAEGGATASCSSALPGYDIHKLEHVHDGQYGNGRSWISNERGGGWVQIELPRVETIHRIDWGRDRHERYRDRLATRYTIEAAVEAGQWVRLAGWEDRLPAAGDAAAAKAGSSGGGQRLGERAAEAQKLFDALGPAERLRDQLAQGPLAYAGMFAQPGPTHRLYRGDPLAKREIVHADGPQRLARLELPPDAPEQQRRVALAEWIAGDDNPLTARVLVNRLWHYHFGVGLVDTPNDFGAAGTRPTHPQLLDWLAGEAVARGGSLKSLHRLILLSATFRQSNVPRPQALAVDADARLLWRFPPRRLEAEAIRDGVLAASGVLDLHMGGPGFSGFEVHMENVRHYFPKKAYGPEDWRRMIYMTKVRQEQDAVFGVFDCPDASQAVPERSRSTTPLQALNLLNSPFMLQQSELFAARLTREAGGDPEDQVRWAFAICLARRPEAEELQAALDVVTRHGLAALCRGLLNASEFLFIP